MATWRESLLTKVGPPLPLCGITARQWRKLLRAVHFDVDSPYRLRAVSTTAWSIVNSVYGWLENKLYGSKVATVHVEPPIIILGHWRTGTTHLHNLMALDSRFAFPNTYQVTYPSTFLCTEVTSTKLGAFFLPPTRPMDNVRVSFQAPNEDEFAICGTTLYSPYVGLMFPRRQADYDPFLTFRGVPEDIIAQWKAALMLFVKKLTWKHGRPLILKSPSHTCRIKLLLDLFPNARFVHIHRNPYDVFQSTCHWLRTAAPWWNLQRPDFDGLEERILRTYRQMYEVFFEEQPLIPAGHFHEIGFEDLEAEPVAEVRKLYNALSLPAFEEVEPALRQYLGSLSEYKKNTLPEPSSPLRERIAREWRRCFVEWGYAVRS